MFEWLLGFDWFSVFCLAFGVSFGQSGGYSHSRSDTQATGPLSGQTREAGQALLNRAMYATEPYLYQAPGFAQIMPRPLNAMGLYEGQQPVNALGLYGGQQQGFEEAVRQAVSQLSGNFSNRGFNRPEAIGAIAGSAAQNVLPQFAPLMGQQVAGQNVLAGGQIVGQDQLRRQLNLDPENIRLQRNQQQLQFMQALAQALGNQSTGYERGWGINASFQHSVGGGGSGGQALGAIMG